MPRKRTLRRRRGPDLLDTFGFERLPAEDWREDGLHLLAYRLEL